MLRNFQNMLGFMIAIGFINAAILSPKLTAQSPVTVKASPEINVQHRTLTVDGLEIFYREAGPKTAPTIVLLHGFPTSSQMFRNLIPKLAEKYHVIAPDYPGFGHSSMPSRSEFEYSFDQLAVVMDHFLEQLKVQSYVLYVQDYGAPIGFRVATAHPERVLGFIVQNGNAYDEGLDNEFWKPKLGDLDRTYTIV